MERRGALPASYQEVWSKKRKRAVFQAGRGDQSIPVRKGGEKSSIKKKKGVRKADCDRVSAKEASMKRGKEVF